MIMTHFLRTEFLVCWEGNLKSILNFYIFLLIFGWNFVFFLIFLSDEIAEQKQPRSTDGYWWILLWFQAQG